MMWFFCRIVSLDEQHTATTAQGCLLFGCLFFAGVRKYQFMTCDHEGKSRGEGDRKYYPRSLKVELEQDRADRKDEKGEKQPQLHRDHVHSVKYLFGESPHDKADQTTESEGEENRCVIDHGEPSSVDKDAQETMSGILVDQTRWVKHPWWYVKCLYSALRLPDRIRRRPAHLPARAMRAAGVLRVARAGAVGRSPVRRQGNCQV